MSPTNLDYKELEQEIIQQLKKISIGVLATAEGDFVTARSMMLISDGLTIYLITTTFTRKYKQIQVNPNVAVAMGNMQIEGVASIKGHPSDNENIWFLKTFEEKAPEVYGGYRNELTDSETPWQVIEISLKRVALFSPDRNLDVLNIIEKTAIRYNGREGFPPNY